MKINQIITEEWSQKYKKSINCSHPKGFSQKAHCAGKKKHNEDITMEMTCPDCGMCQTHGNLNEIKKGAKDSNGYTKCWAGYHAAGTKKSATTGKQVRNCVPNESVDEAKWDPWTGGDFSDTHDMNHLPNNDAADSDKSRAEQFKAMIQYYGNDMLVKRALMDLYSITHGEGVTGVNNDLKFEATFERNGKTQVKYFRTKKDVYNHASVLGRVVSIKPIESDLPTNLITLPVMLGLGDHKKKWMLQFPDERIAQKWEFQHKNAAQIQWPSGHGLNESAKELDEEFDLIESIINNLANSNQVDPEVIWEDLESLSDDELYVFAATMPIMEDWQKANKKDKTDGMSQKAVNSYRREHPGSKLKTAVTTKPSKLKKGSKASKRRKSYCSRSKGQMKMHSISCAKTPDKAICKARRRWNCE
jgi:hypothetical protein